MTILFYFGILSRLVTKIKKESNALSTVCVLTELIERFAHDDLVKQGENVHKQAAKNILRIWAQQVLMLVPNKTNVDRF